MRRYLVKIGLISFIPAVIYVVLWQFLVFKKASELQRFDVFILGDSQTQFINHSKVFNHSIEGSPYFVQYGFAKKFINEIAGKKVYVACNYHNLSKLYQNRLKIDSLLPGWGASNLELLNKYELMNWKHPELHFGYTPSSSIDIKKLPKLIKELYLKKPLKNISENIANDTSLVKEDIDRHWRNDKYVLNDTIQEQYLTKLICLLKENQCEVKLIKMPLTRFYKGNVPNYIKTKLSNIVANFDLEVLDLDKELKLSYNYKYFKDYGHLNTDGDSIVNRYLNLNEF